MTSRQQNWQQKRVAEGKCPHCGGPPAAGKTLCAERLEYLRKRARERRRTAGG